jgi:hypothetical protein
MARALRSQGLRGTAYGFPSGDMKEYVRLIAAKCSEPMPPSSHAVAARVVPFDHGVIREHGNNSFSPLAQHNFGNDFAQVHERSHRDFR